MLACAWITVIALCSLCVQGATDTDLQYLASIFPGFYDNVDQYESDIKNRIPPAERHLHLSMSISPQEVPILEGRTNFYLEEYTDGNPNELVRQRIYSFGLDGEAEIQLQFYTLDDPAKYAHSKPYSPQFRNLTWKDISFIEGCDVYWDRIDDSLFRSHMFNTCVVPYEDIKIIITDTNDLSPWYLTVKETWLCANNGTVINSISVPYNLTKQRGIKNGRAVCEEHVSFDNVLKALASGHTVRYKLNAEQCEGAGSKLLSGTIQGEITIFNLINGHTPYPYISFVASSPERGAIFDHRGVIHKSGAVNLSVNPNRVLSEIVTCTYSSDAGSLPISFFSDVSCMGYN